MALNTFDPSPRPSPGTGIANKVSLRTADFGDGYTLSAPAGLNHIRKQITLKWDALTRDEAFALDTFFIGQGGNVPFYFVLNGETAPRKWTCAEWSMTDAAPCTFTATLVENFTILT
ncbi:phage tail protein [Paenirhodobacter hankyongi]|uniref:Phage tail protein n=1 Tax=Paenirhodobacter hankyongi TaxID=2294033 RepID=A0A421BN81_9RHOB|nr:phage tail protein [Sinirhodobacter hankyongi]RLL64288.1 phage tail protein [Sinirhodobacter hankyongi]